MEQETATLVLNTFDINSSVTAADYYNVTVDNEFGTIANNRCNITWKNINIKRVLGEDIYNKYETFNIYLYQINQSQAFSAGSPSFNNQLLVDVRIKGLQFLNNTYNVVSRNNTNTAYLTAYLLNNVANGVAGTGSVTPMFNPSILTFSKHSEYVDINIDMKTIMTAAYPLITAATSFGTFIFMFKINGIPTREKNIITNGTKMLINK